SRLGLVLGLQGRELVELETPDRYGEPRAIIVDEAGVAYPGFQRALDIAVGEPRISVAAPLVALHQELHLAFQRGEKLVVEPVDVEVGDVPEGVAQLPVEPVGENGSSEV